MFLKHLALQNFRNYPKFEFNFTKKTTFIIGKNTAGKTNLIEAVFFLASGKSFRAEKDFQAIQFNKDLARVKGIISLGDFPEETKLEVLIINSSLNGREIPSKKYLINGVGKRRVDFSGNFTAVLFSPQDLEIIVDSPGLRRNFLDEVLEQVDREYRLALTSYTKALRQRNALLDLVKETGRRNEKQFEYWDHLLIENGTIVAQKRKEFIDFVNSSEKEIFDLVMFYDKSVVSKERLLQYKEAEEGAGITLVGPHRDDFYIHMFNNVNHVTHDIKLYGSRGQQRLAILQLKFLQLLFIEKRTGERPIFLLDDIFSELDEKHIKLVTEIIHEQQSIITTTHQEFVDKKLLKEADMIELNK